MDLLGVVAADFDAAEQAAEQSGARVGDLVETKRRFRELGEDRQQARAGRRFEDEVGRRQHRRFGGGEAERYRRRELLQLFGFLGTPGLRRQPCGEPREHLEHGRGRTRARAHRRAELAQEQHLRRLEGLVGVLPYPRAFRVAAAEGRLHGRAQRAAVDRAPLAQELREQGSGMDQARHLVGRGLRQEQRKRRRGGRRGGGWDHHEDVSESEVGRIRSGALFLRPDLTRSRLPSPSSRAALPGVT